MALKIRVHERLNEAFSPKTVKIGDQVWMAENLAIDDGKGGIFYNEENGEYYYTWDAAMRVAKSIPGWHLPKKKQDMVDSLNYVNTVRELKNLLSIKYVGYYSPQAHQVVNNGSSAHLWLADYHVHDFAYSWTYYPSGNYEHGIKNIHDGISVRLVKD